MSNRDGGPAFPTISALPAYGPNPGMTMRDYFAAKALPWALPQRSATTVNRFEVVAADAYAVADAMLAERSKP